MSNLALDKYSISTDSIMKESGDKSYPIWLLVNPNHFAMFQVIWAPILDEIQDKVYRKLRTRIETENIFIKSTVSDIGIAHKTSNCQAAEVTKEIELLQEIVLEHQPKILITFGAITYELVRRAFEIKSQEGPMYWNSTNLEHEFERSIANFDINQTNRIPIPFLRQIMKSGRVIEDRNYSSWEDSEIYFRYVGTKIADRIIENKDSFKYI
ncbi:hypothetical protein [Desulfosporosinus sp. OT]|uniref:hypothetical protein n=1 Tax=Desulfosporosinus sp. OT TaxID=913865 RepID=UPI000223AC9E|nr:hypothetical protein [Desulfosporosinus sp. OT]EGW37537.1 hypothetical protein DOT_4548 [Desulfosporosinus sp. OT]